MCLYIKLCDSLTDSIKYTHLSAFQFSSINTGKASSVRQALPHMRKNKLI